LLERLWLFLYYDWLQFEITVVGLAVSILWADSEQRRSAVSVDRERD